MKNKLFYCIIIVVISFSLKAQTWSPVGTGINGSAANTTWSLFAYDSVLYAGGWFNTAGGVSVNDIAQWNGTNWSTTGTGSSGFINSMDAYKGNLYVGGLFDSIGGVSASNIAMWNGTIWSPVGKGIKAAQYGPYAMAVYNGYLYAGGAFDSADGKYIFGIAKWDGTNWSSLGTGISATDEESGVFALVVYKGELYLGGDFSFSGGTNIAKWNGTTFSTVGGGAVGPIYALAAYNGNLYAGGFVNLLGATQVNNIGAWNGTTWSTLDSGISGNGGWATVNALASYNGKLYVGGAFDTANGRFMNCIAAWDGTTWSSVGSGIGAGGSVDVMTVFNNSLYVGGGFDSVGGVYAQNIAMWNTPDEVNSITRNEINIQVFPNPVISDLSVSGSFKNAVFYSVYNELGQNVQEGKFIPVSTNKINVSSLAPGLYLVSIISEGKRYNCMFIKE